MQKLEHWGAHGPAAFTFRQPFPRPVVTGVSAPDEAAEFSSPRG